MTSVAGSSVLLLMMHLIGGNYIDVRLRFAIRWKIENLHSIAIQINGSDTREHIHCTVSQFLDGLLGDMWKSKLISKVTDGARSMTDKVSGAVTSFERDAQPEGCRIWCPPHQLDLIIQELMTGLLYETFRRNMGNMIAHLRRQYNWRDKMGTTRPTIAVTRWLLLGCAARWMSTHPSQIIQHLQEGNSALLPGPKWWVLLAAIKVFVEPIDICFKYMQVRGTVVPEQNMSLNRLVSSLKSAVSISEPLDSIDLLSSASSWAVISSCNTSKGILVVYKQIIVYYLEDFSMYTEDDLNKITEQVRTDTCKLVGNMHLTAYKKYVRCKSEETQPMLDPH